MASVHIWLDILSYTKALFEAITLGADIQKQYEKHHNEQDTIAEAERASEVFSTYSEEEGQAILKRLKECRDRFVREGVGAARAKCLCSVFRDVMDGNGGVLPRIDDWENIYGQLKCKAD
jgi:hypothetical protein